jgi:hypothetical protein
MARLYANENFPLEVVLRLRDLGHDVLTTHEAGKASQGIEDDAVLRFAISTDRCVITLNRRDFIRLHQAAPLHPGIIVCTENRNYPDFVKKIDLLIRQSGALANQILRVKRGTL